MQHHHVRVLFLVAGVLLTASCSDDDARLFSMQPSDIGSSSVVLRATSTTAIAKRVSNPFCPSVAPFTVPLDVTVTAAGSTDVIVTGFRLLFTDTEGRQAPQVTLPMLPVTLPAAGPTAQFGSAQTFPLTLGIGCSTGTRGTVVIIVDTSDDRGRHRTEQVSVAVR